MSQKYKGKQSNNIYRQKRSKEKSLQVAQKRGAKILLVPNPADPLKSSSREKLFKKLDLYYFSF
jgi:hypothetical protein